MLAAQARGRSRGDRLPVDKLSEDEVIARTRPSPA